MTLSMQPQVSATGTRDISEKNVAPAVPALVDDAITKYAKDLAAKLGVATAQAPLDVDKRDEKEVYLEDAPSNPTALSTDDARITQTDVTTTPDDTTVTLKEAATALTEMSSETMNVFPISTQDQIETMEHDDIIATAVSETATEITKEAVVTEIENVTFETVTADSLDAASENLTSTVQSDPVTTVTDKDKSAGIDTTAPVTTLALTSDNFTPVQSDQTTTATVTTCALTTTTTTTTTTDDHATSVDDTTIEPTTEVSNYVFRE